MKPTTKILFTSILLISFIFAKSYKGAEYRTHDTFTYGRFEVCYKSSSGPGQISTFFTYHELGAAGTAEWNEIDIEILGRYRNDVQFNPLTRGQVNHVYHQFADFDPAEAFHIYAFEWTPEYVAWFIDGEEKHRQTGEHIEGLDLGQKIMMNIWPPAAESWVGALEPASLPKFAYYDFVSYYTYTPGSGNYGTDNNFIHAWTDDFDTWDSSRWGKATHTFGGNNCDFVTENVIFQDGKMILCLTDATNLGYTDKNPPVAQEASYNSNYITIRFSEEIEKTSAETPGNYLLRNGGTVQSITLDEARREVVLNVSGYDPAIAHDILVINIQDLFGNISGPKFLNIINPPVYAYPLKINVGGIAYAGFLADQEWAFEKNYGHVSGWEGSTGNPISNTDIDAVYRSEIRDFVLYKIRVPKGIYNITLMFSENYFTENSRRVFDVNIEGNYVVKELDVHQEAGGINTAYDLSVENIEVDDAVIDIHFGASKDFAFLHGLVVDQVSETEIDEKEILPEDARLYQNYPNPFNGSTSIKYDLLSGSMVDISILDLWGNLVTSLKQGYQQQGKYEVNWTPACASGVYLVKMKADDFVKTGKMLYLK
ncbi:MAG: family 16 glycosylhydrolase [Candidatus Marinimicrobia bacterium]|nr:family 16 glycosylhydrolase [Candidatus Neomarinimicrobiota bacterium]